MPGPEIWLCRHGETAWSREGRHTSHTDLPLTPDGVEEARRLAPLLARTHFDLVLTSPLRRAADTAVLAGFVGAVTEPAAGEWDYGDYEGRSTAEIRLEAPGWTVWARATPNGEVADQVGARADQVIDRVCAEARTRALVFSHAHFLRVLGARWIGLPAAAGAHLLFGTGAVSVLGWERETRAIARWNVAETGSGGPSGAP